MEYETKYSGTSAGTEEYELDPSHNETEREYPFDPVGEFYSVGTDQATGLKEQIASVHGPDSRQVSFINELEDFLGNSDNYHQASQKFKTFARSHMKTPRNADYLVDEFVNSGYITALERLRAPGSGNDLEFYQNYAATHGITPSQAMLFGPNGTARQSFARWQLEELLRGQHRGNYKPENKQMAKAFDEAAINTHNLPSIQNKDGKIKQMDLDADKGKLPAGIESEIVKAFGRERQIYQGNWYKGTKRLSGDLPYRIVEALALELLAKQNNYKADRSITCQSELERIIEEANETGQDAFLALYNHSGKNGALKGVWDKARKTLNNRAELLWQKRDLYSEQIAARSELELPGTVYLNNGRYYWLPKSGEKAVPLIPDKEKNKLPGSLLKNGPGGYFWWIPHLKFRRRLVPNGQKIATKDLKTAKKLQRQEWEKIQKYEPQLAATLRGMRKWGAATKHKSIATKIAKKHWSQMQETDPQTAARIKSDKRPEITKPDVDTVWPSWAEQKTRLVLIEDKPQIPIVYPKQDLRNEWKYGLRVPEKLEPMVDKIKKVDWMVRDAMLVFEDKSPVASKEIAIQSNGKEWTDEQEQNGKRFVTQGSTSIDRDTGRIRISIYNPGYGSKRTLAEQIYHIVYDIIREASPGTFRAIQTWHEKNIDNGSDSTVSISGAFAGAMAEEELGYDSGLPRNIVKHAQKVFSSKNSVGPSILEQVKSNLSGLG